MGTISMILLSSSLIIIIYWFPLFHITVDHANQSVYMVSQVAYTLMYTHGKLLLVSNGFIVAFFLCGVHPLALLFHVN